MLTADAFTGLENGSRYALERFNPRTRSENKLYNFPCSGIFGAQIKQKANTMKSKKEYSLDNDTPLIPELVAERIQCSVLARRYVCFRARLHYKKNAQFRKTLRKDDAPDMLMAWFEHWINGMIARKRLVA